MENILHLGFAIFDRVTYLRDRVLIWILEHRMTLIKISVILAVMGGSVVIAFGISRYTILFAGLAALPLIYLAVEFILLHFELFPIIILATAAFIPLSLPTGTGSRLVFSLVATLLFFGIWFIHMLIIEKRFKLEPSPLNFPILAFMAVTAISLIWSNVFRDPLVVTWRSFPFVQAASTIVMIMLPMALLLVANLIKDEKTLKLLIGIMLIAGVLGIPRQFFGIRLLPVNTGGLYNMWIILYAASLGLFHNGLTKWQRALLLSLAGLWVFWGVGLHISWLAGWLPGLAGLAVVILMRSKKLAVWVGVGVVILIILNFSAVSDYVIHVVEAESAESGETRVAAWIVNWGITKEHWLFGTGPAGYAAYYMSYFPMDGMATHSNYIDIVAQTGFAGLILTLWIFFGLAWLGYRVAVRLRDKGNFLEAAANAALAGTLGCILMMAFGDWLFPFAYTQSIAGFDYAVYNWLFMGTILVIDRLTQPATQSQTQVTPA